MSSPLPTRYVGPERIYHGERADVYSALDRELGRKVAIKILAQQCAKDEQQRAWLRREAMAIARLSHMVEVVRIYDVGDWRGRPYMAMEFLGGGSLASRLKRGGVTRELALRWLWQAASAIDAAHGLGLVHRDVTPHNLLLDVRDNLRLTDFGIATARDGRSGEGDEELIQGTGGFIAPEHLAGEPAEPASDVYALGAVARVLLAEASDVNDRAPEVQTVLSQALASRPADRFGTARDFVRELQSALVPETATTQVFHGAATEVFARPTRVFTSPMRTEPKPVVKTSPLLPVIALERAARAVVLAVVGLGAIVLRNHLDLSIRGTTVRLDANVNPAQDAYDHLVRPVGQSTPHDLVVLGIVALALAGLYAIESLGLAARLRAAVYLTVVATLALLPFEVWEIMQHPGHLKEALLAVNAAVAASLGATLVRGGLRARRARHAMAAARVSV
jgi:uncharacterized membrane protein (DUF2068 family)